MNTKLDHVSHLKRICFQQFRGNRHLRPADLLIGKNGIPGHQLLKRFKFPARSIGQRKWEVKIRAVFILLLRVIGAGRLIVGFILSDRFAINRHDAAAHHREKGSGSAQYLSHPFSLIRLDIEDKHIGRIFGICFHK